jgi:hypothetical protein
MMTGQALSDWILKYTQDDATLSQSKATGVMHCPIKIVLASLVARKIKVPQRATGAIGLRLRLQLRALLQLEAMTNVRKSKRVVKKRDLSHTLCLDTHEESELTNVDVGEPINVRTVRTTSKKRHSAKDIMNNAISIEDPLCTAIVAEEEFSCDTNVAYQTNEVVDDFDISTFGGGLRWPEDGIRCAGRKGTTRLLWLHEFYVVNEGTARQPKLSVYQALQFLVGANYPKGYVEDMTEYGFLVTGMYQHTKFDTVVCDKQDTRFIHCITMVMVGQRY